MTFANTTRSFRAPEAPDALLMEILQWARPHDSDTEKRFCREYLDKVPGMTRDAFGNRMIAIGHAPSVLWSCHVDTVAKRGGWQALAYNEATGILSLDEGRAGQSLGADDGVGVWIMLNMIAAKRPGLYVFHRGEEVGCLGSRWIVDNTPELLSGIQAAIAFDRQGHRDIITHQSSGMTASDSFADSFAAQLNSLCPAFAFRADDGGVFTDTNEYAGLVPECSNVSVGYYGNHGPRETLDVIHANDLMAAMLAFDASRITISREPGDRGYDDYYGYTSGAYSTGSTWRNGRDDDGPTEGDVLDLRDAILQYPRLVAELMAAEGWTADAIFSEAVERDDATALAALDDSDRPLWDVT